MTHFATLDEAFSVAEAELASALNSGVMKPDGFQPLNLLFVEANGCLIAVVAAAASRFDADERWLR